MKKFSSRAQSASRLWWAENKDVVDREAPSNSVGAKSHISAELFKQLPPEDQAVYVDKVKAKQNDIDPDECFE